MKLAYGCRRGEKLKLDPPVKIHPVKIPHVKILHFPELKTKLDKPKALTAETKFH